ncbi:MAG: hypothetical protein ACR2IE_11335 [Candidatus Sumerlaeaceae bacterium]
MSGALKAIIVHGKIYREPAGRTVIVLDDLPADTNGCTFEGMEVVAFVQAVGAVIKQADSTSSDFSQISDSEWESACSSNDAFDFLRDDENCEGFFDNEPAVCSK